jgi:hypothetical protein
MSQYTPERYVNVVKHPNNKFIESRFLDFDAWKVIGDMKLSSVF